MLKTLKYIFVAIFALAVSSCDKEEIGGTATQDLAGEWMVKADIVDASGNVIAEDPYGLGYFQVITYNTAANIPTEMWVSDTGNFWEFTAKVPCDAAAQTFGSSTAVPNLDYDCMVTITNGKVTYGGTLSPSGAIADAIEFTIAFDDDEGGYTYLLSGYRRTGLQGGEE